MAWNRALKSAMDVAVSVGATSVFGNIPFVGSGLASIAAGVVKDVQLPQTSKYILFYMTDVQNANLFKSGLLGMNFQYYHTGNSGATYRVISDANLCKGAFAICLENTYKFDAVDVEVEVVAIIKTEHYRYENYTERVVNPRTEKRIFKDPVVRTSQVPCVDND